MTRVLAVPPAFPYTKDGWTFFVSRCPHAEGHHRDLRSAEACAAERLADECAARGSSGGGGNPSATARGAVVG